MAVRSIEINNINVVVCLSFDHRAAGGEIESFKQQLMQSGDVRHSLESTGTFDFMVEFAFPDFAAYTARMKSLAEPLARLVERYETSFIGRRFVPETGLCDDLWVPCRDGFQRIRCRDIDIVSAQGDYVRIQAGANSWLMNGTMGAMVDRLDPRRFLQIHRSTIVRKAFVDRLAHGEGRWMVTLVDGTTHRVARSHATQAVAMLRGDSSMKSAPPRLVLHSNDVMRSSMESSSAA